MSTKEMSTAAAIARREYYREYRAKNHEKLKAYAREYNKRYRQEHPDRYEQYRNNYWERRANKDMEKLREAIKAEQENGGGII